MAFKTFNSTKELYISALEQAIKYNESFFDAYWDGRSSGKERDEQLKRAMGDEAYTVWKEETEDFEKKYRQLTKGRK